MKSISKITALVASLVMLLPVTGANAEMLYEATTLNSDGGGLNATSWPSLNDGLILVDDISVPASGWTINEVSNFFTILGTPTVSNAYLIVFPKSLGQINPYDYKTEVPVAMTNETFTDPSTGQSRDTYRIDAIGLNLQLIAGDYWIGLSPIAPNYSTNCMAWGSRTANGDKAICYDKVYNGTGGWVGTAFWTGPDYMMRIKGTPETAISSTNATPNSVSLQQNYPNPFNPTTTISFELKSAGSVKLSVFDATGKMVSELVNSSLTAGVHNVEFKAANLNSGTYFYKLQTAGVTQTKKMLMVK